MLLGGAPGWSTDDPVVREPPRRGVARGGAFDLVAFLPNREPCAALGADRSTENHEFHRRGPDALTLGSEATVCPILGIAQPLPGSG